MIRQRHSPNPILDAWSTLGVRNRYHSIVSWERDCVRAAVVELGQGTAELIGLGAAAVHGVSPTSHPDIDRWVAGCDRALTQAEDMTQSISGFKRVPDLVSMTVPAEMARRLPITASIARRHPTRSITQEELSALLERGYRKAQDIVGTRGRQTDAEIVHGAVAQLALDGQLVTDALGLHGTEIQARMSFAVIPLEWVRALETVCERLELRLVAIVPHDVVYAAPLVDPSALLIILDERHTTVDMVRYGRLEWCAHTRLGERDLVEQVAKNLGLEGHQADALLHVYRGGQLPPASEMRVARSFWIELQHWMDAISESVVRINGDQALPHHVYFLDATRRIPEAQQSLDTPYWEQRLPFDRCPETMTLDVGMVHGVLDCTTQAIGPAYLLLRGLAHYVASLYGPGRSLDRILASLIAQRRLRY